jgi:glycosyltransferase involved in cell wall biosynthesis
MRIRTLFMLPVYPMRDPFFCYRFYREVKKLCREFSFPLLVSTFCPFESLWAGFRMRQKSDIFYCVYAVDTLTGQLENNILSKEFRDKSGFKWEKKIFAVSDLILFFKSHEQEFADPRYDRWRSKIKFVDVPLLKDRTTARLNTNEGVRRIVYTGTVYPSQLPLLPSAFDCLNKIPDVSVQFFGQNPTLPQLSFVENRGSVSKEAALSAQTSAAALMSIGLADSCFISSKIFEYMSTGKPIIHFYCRDDDPTLPYYKKYPAVLLVDSRGEVNENAAMITAFLANPPDTVPFSQLEKHYPENRASRTLQVIRDHFERQN